MRRFHRLFPLLDRAMDTRARDDAIIPFDGRRGVAAWRLPRTSRARALGRHRTLSCQWKTRRRGGPVGRGRHRDRRDQVLPYRLSERRQVQDYGPYCDRLYFAVAADFPREIIPPPVGLILADRYGAELVRDPVEERLSPARRKAMMLAFGRAAALRLQLHLDPSCGFEA
jgi:DNA repair protein MmcB-like